MARYTFLTIVELIGKAVLWGAVLVAAALALTGHYLPQ